MQGRSANHSRQGDPGRSTRAPSSRPRPRGNGHPWPSSPAPSGPASTVSAALGHMDIHASSAGAVTSWHGVVVEPRDRLNVTAKATTIGLGPTGAGLKIGTTTGAIHARRLRRKRYRITATKPCGSARRGMLKVCTKIYRNDSDGRPSRASLMPFGAGIR